MMARSPIFTKTWTKRPPGAPATPQHKWNVANQDKLRAHALVRQALRAGTLKRGKCEVCGSLRVDAHHDDYSTPLEVRWFCRTHHQKHHAEMRRQEAAE